MLNVKGLSVSLFCVLLIPVDIYSVSTIQNTEGDVILTPEEIETRSASLRILYYSTDIKYYVISPLI